MDLINARTNYDFFETKYTHSKFIYDDYGLKKIKLNILDACCGLGSLSEIWYFQGHHITMVELNPEFIPALKKKFPNANIINDNILNYKCDKTTHFDIILCNPPFNTDKYKTFYMYIFTKLIQLIDNDTTLYFICPTTFYKNQEQLNMEISYNNPIERLNTKIKNYFLPNEIMKKYSFIQIDSTKLNFNSNMIKNLINMEVIEMDFIIKEDKSFIISPNTFDIRFLKIIDDFDFTSIKCGLFKIVI